MSEQVTRLSADLNSAADQSGRAVPPSEFLIFKTGVTLTDYGPFTYDAASAASIRAREEKRGRKPWMDYEHKSHDEKNPDSTAACTFDLDYRPEGLYAINVDWRPAAKKKIEERELFATSPAFNHTKDGHITGFLNIALTNNPGTWHLQPLVKATAQRIPNQEIPMNKTLLKALGCAADADEADALDEATRLTEIRRQVTTLTERKDASEAIGVLLAWKQSHENTAKLTAEIAQLKADSDKREIAAMLEKASTVDGKLTPDAVAKLNAKVDAGELNKTALAAMIEVLPVMASQSPAATPPSAVPDAGAYALTECDIEMARATGTKVEDLRARVETRNADKAAFAERRAVEKVKVL